MPKPRKQPPATPAPSPTASEPLAWIRQDLRALARPISTLAHDPRNARKHGSENLRSLTASLRAHGQVKPLVVRQGVVIAGNGTLEAARALGWSHLACVEFAGSDLEARAFAIADNRTAELATWDDAILAESLRDLDDAGFLDATGFDESAMADALDTADQAEAPPGAEDPGPTEAQRDEDAASKPGEIYALGPHRLLCGDSTDADAVARLFGGERASLVATDPPYGIAYVGGLRPGLAAILHKRQDGKQVENDALGEEGTRDLLRSALAAVPCEPGASVYAASPAGTLLPWLIEAFQGSGFTFKHSLVWVKDAFVLGRCDYHYRHEVILFGWRDDGGHYFVEDRTQDSVFEFDRPRRSEEHPTMKPVELYERLIANSSRRGEVVYDPFTGSGTTLIAAAKQGRRFVGCEIAPRYADVIRRRWTQWAREAGVDPGTGALE